MLKCSICKKNFETKAARTQHMMTVHPNGGPRRARKVNALSYGGAKTAIDYQFKFPDMLATRLGKTPAGRKWAYCALHPCGQGEIISTEIGDLSGLPDTMTGAVVTPVYPGETYINWDPALFGPEFDPDVSGTFGVDVIIPPVPEVDYMYRLIYTDGSVKSSWRVVRLPNMALPAMHNAPLTTRGVTFASLGYGKVRTIASGHTFELDCNSTNRQGRIVAAQIEGQWTDLDVNAGRIKTNSGTFLTSATPLETASALTQAVYLANPQVMKTQILAVPTDPSVLTAACPGAYQADAEEGAYVVTKFASPLLGYQFKRSGDDGIFATDDGAQSSTTPSMESLPMTAFGINTLGYGNFVNEVDNLEILYSDSNYSGDNPDETDLLAPIAENTGLVTNNSEATFSLHPFVSQASDMMVSVITFRNLALSSTGTVSSNPVIRVKSRNYFECIPNAQNPATTPFTHGPAPYDYDAINAVVTVGKQMADAYPSSANDLGEMLGTIWDGVKEIAEPLAKEIGTLDIPIVSKIAQQIGSSIHSNADAVNARLARIRALSKTNSGRQISNLIGGQGGIRRYVL